VFDRAASAPVGHAAARQTSDAPRLSAITGLPAAAPLLDCSVAERLGVAHALQVRPDDAPITGQSTSAVNAPERKAGACG